MVHHGIYTFVSLSVKLAKAKYKTPHKRQRLGEAALRCCLLLFLSLFFIEQVFPPDDILNGSSPQSQYTGTCVSSTDNFFHNPVDPENPGMDLEILTEPQDNKKSKNFDWAALIAHFASASCHLFFDNIHSTLPTLVFQKGEKVPLFILYHAWKTFLH